MIKAYLVHIGIIILAELLRWACPWYLWQCVLALTKSLCRPMFFGLAVTLFVLIPSADEYATYRVTPFEELRGVLAPDFTPLPPEEPLAEEPFVEEPRSNFLNDDDFARLFPTPDELRHHVEFWKNIFGRYHNRQLLVYDSWYPQLVYEVIDRDAGPVNVTARIRAYRAILHALHRKEQRGELDDLTPEEARIYALFATVTEKDRFANAAGRDMRALSGQYNRFLQAIQMSGLYHDEFLRIFHEHGVPVELTWLPFVESYYNYKAYSHAGAAGVWQFIASTARLYDLKITAAADERFDPFKSADAAARLLKANYELLHTWPLAITAYNHGTVGMLRAVRQFDTTDFGVIATHYRSSTFGFYSRNYYAQFVAVAQLMRENQQHFQAIDRLPALKYEEVQLAERMYLHEIAEVLQISVEDLEILNRDLKKSVLKSTMPIPKHFRLKVPIGAKDVLLAAIE
jgi:membrane-bound lytic murein transglycosylase D